MTINEWRSALSDLLATVPGEAENLRGLRALTFGLWELFVRSPPDVHREFERLTEAELTAGVRDLAERITSGDDTLLTADEDLPSTVATAGRLLRALELAVISLGSFAGAPRTAADLQVRYAGREGYLLPFPPRYRDPGQDWPGYFARRGLQRTRCIPKQLSSGHVVEVVYADAGLEEKPLRCAAELFPSVVPLDAEGHAIDFAVAEPFIFHALQPTPEVDIRAGLERCATSDHCDIVVYPELTMPPERRSELVRLLRTRPWDPELQGMKPAFVLAGSWHDKGSDGQYRNCAPVLDGNGRVLGWHAKLIPFTRDALAEDIRPENSILVIATDSGTIAVGICLDFCGVGRLPHPYDDLDVDLVLVCSMGGVATMESHRDQARRLWNNRKTGTFVAQQIDVGAFGYVGALPHPGEQFIQRITEAHSIHDL